jgi:hypothetical protein
MIFSQRQNQKKPKSGLLPIILVSLLVVLFLLKSITFNKKTTTQVTDNTIYECSAEVIKDGFFVEKGVQFGGAASQADKYVRTGKHSSLVDSNNMEGLSYTIQNPVAGKTYKAEIWQYKRDPSDLYLAVSAENPADFYQETDQTVSTEGTWWMKMEQFFTIPKGKKLSSIKIFAYKKKKDGKVWVDDLKITELDTLDFFSSSFTPDDFHLNINEKGLQKLKTIKQRAFSKSVLIQTDDDWIKAKATTTNGEKKAKVRLKGDWLDHIFKGKSSFRVQLDSEDSWKGMQTFSVQSPETRGMLREWVYHQMLGYVGVLSPRYDFINFHLNDKSPLIYVYEEHFNKNLVENQLRREGPIVKLTEDRFWEGMSRSMQMSRGLASGRNKEKAFWSSEIKPFKGKKTAKSPALKASFTVAQNLVEQYKYGLKSTSEVFDIELLAKYMAVTDILQADHSLTWHNQRFYYNPVTALLEPIGFDGYGSGSPDKPSGPLYAEKVYTQQSLIEPLHRLFYDKMFVTAYLKYLQEYAQPSFIKQFLAEIEEPLSAREAFIKTKKANYSYNRSNLMVRANKIQETVVPFSNSLKVFTETTEGDSATLHLENAHILPLEVVFIGKNKIKTDKKTGNSTWVYPSKEGDLPNYTTVKAPKWATKVHYKMAGFDSTFVAEIPAWKAPTNWSPRQELLATTNNSTPKYTENGHLILFENKKYEIKTPLILPKGKQVVFQPGAHLEFSEGGFLMSFSAVQLRGDEDEPIVFESLDNNSGAFVVMQAQNESIMRHVIFKNQNTLAYKGWNLTGAVTFYESDVQILACRFMDNHCEDGLNIVRSDFEVTQSAFVNIFSDAFDADFCKGKVLRCAFDEIGNDALDFSTSIISIDQCKMNNVGDKAISAGENATITATNIDVENANIGFASKDFSRLTLDKVTVSNSSKGFTAYQKKPEYGPATINLGEHTLSKVKFPFMIEPTSFLNK